MRQKIIIIRFVIVALFAIIIGESGKKGIQRNFFIEIILLQDINEY